MKIPSAFRKIWVQINHNDNLMMTCKIWDGWIQYFALIKMSI